MRNILDSLTVSKLQLKDLLLLQTTTHNIETRNLPVETV